MLRSNNFLVKVELSHLGNRYLIDTISLYTNTIKEYSNNSGSYLDIEWPYRENITTNKLGEWVLTITPLNSTTDYSPIDGFGVRCTKEDTYEFKR